MVCKHLSICPVEAYQNGMSVCVGICVFVRGGGGSQSTLYTYMKWSKQKVNRLYNNAISLKRNKKGLLKEYFVMGKL